MTKTLLQRLSEESMSRIVGGLLRHPDKEYRYRFEQQLDKIKIAYELTPESYAKDILLGTYKLMIDKWEHTFGEKFDNVMHSRIQREIKDRQEITRWHKKRIYGSEAKADTK